MHRAPTICGKGRIHCALIISGNPLEMKYSRTCDKMDGIPYVNYIFAWTGEWRLIGG